MSYELLQQDPGTYILLVLISLVITLVAYGTFPMIFARARHKTITKRKYKVICYCVNLVVMMLFIAINGESSTGGPYLIWTWVFSASGIKTLTNRGLLNTAASTACTNDANDAINHIDNNTNTVTTVVLEETPPIRFCRKCGYALVAGSAFCSKCGTAVIKE